MFPRRVAFSLGLTLTFLLCALTAHAQFPSQAPVQDGTISANEYGTHSDGQNQQSNGVQKWYMTWDDTNLYVALEAANINEAAIIYIDKDAGLPPTSGTNTSGNLTGQPYDNTSFNSLPFRADFVAYIKSGYREYRTANGSGGWSSATTGFGSYGENGGTNTREVSIPWSAITGGSRPAAFNFFAYATSAGGFVYGQVPGGNSAGTIGTSATWTRYFGVLSTGNGTSTKPFSRDTIDATVGNAGATYTTLKAAFDAINNAQGGLTGAVNLYVVANTTETASAVLNASGTSGGSGTSSYTSVTIRPTTTATISGNITGILVDLNGADNVTIDGRIGGTGTTKSLTIAALNNTGITTFNGVTVRFKNDATYDIIRFVSLQGAVPGTSDTSAEGVVLFNDSATSGSSNNNITIDNCDIRDSSGGTPFNGIVASASTGTNTAVTISNNNIYNFASANYEMTGLRVNSGATGWTITGNSFYSTASRSTSVSNKRWQAIYISNTSGNGFAITNNYIGGTAAQAGGGALSLSGTIVFTGIRLTVGTTTATSVQGNTIANVAVSSTSSSTAQAAMQLNTGAISVGDVTGNTIGSQSTTGSLSFSTGGGQVTGILAGTGTPGTMTISNNTIGGISVTSSTGTGLRGISFEDTSSATITISNNVVGSTTTADSLSNTSSAAVYGISSTTRGTTTISNNTIANVTTTGGSTSSVLIGIRALPTSGANGVFTISGNTVRDLKSNSTQTATGSSAAVIGITNQANGQSGQVIRGNTIYSLSNTAGSAAVNIVGINFNGPAGTNTVERNLIHTLTLSTSAASTASLTGVYIGGGTLDVKNNMLRLGLDGSGSSITTGYKIEGIYFGTGTANFYYNSVYVGGTGVQSSQNTAAFDSGVTLNTRIFKNNIFVNARSNASGTAVNAAAIIAGTLPNPSGLSSDYNLVHALVGVLGSGGTLFRNGANNYNTVAAWTTASGQDANSLSSDPLFVNATASTPNLHINATSNNISPVESGGTPIAGLTNDYDNDTRNATTPDIGADEFTATGTQLNTTYNVVTVPAGQTFTLMGNTTVRQSLTLNGLLNLGMYTLTLGLNASISGTPSATAMFIADGGGQVCKQFTGAGSFTFPIGDNTGTPEYSPATLNFTAGTFAAGAQACVNVTNLAHPSGDQTNYPTYISRYWTATQSGITSFSCNASFTYTDADLTVGSGQSEATMALWKYDAPTWTGLALTSAASNLLSDTVTSFSDFTGRSASPLAVRLAGFTGALVDGQPVLTWETVSEQDNAGFNVYRGASEQGPWAKANDALIASAAPGSSVGQSYRWTDAGAQPATVNWYLLEDVDLNGTVAQHGPVRVNAVPNAVQVSMFAARPDWGELFRRLMGVQ